MFPGFCLEEMLGPDIESGVLFYGKTRKRQDVAFDENLRSEIERMAQTFQALMDSRTTPKTDCVTSPYAGMEDINPQDLPKAIVAPYRDS